MARPARAHARPPRLRGWRARMVAFTEAVELRRLPPPGPPPMLTALMTPAFPRRALVGLAAAATASRASAQTIIPDEGIDILVGFQSTGGPDVVARRIAAELERRIGRRIGVENRPGDSGARPGEV